MGSERASGRQISAAWKKWLSSDDGQRCVHPLSKTNSHMDPSYLRNRLQLAFEAGADAVLRATEREETSEHE